MRRPFSRLLVAGSLVTGLAVVSAQQLTSDGVLSGVVRFTNGDPVKDRCVRLRNMDLSQAVADSRTNDNGEYRFTNLKPAVYAVEVLNDDCSGVIALSRNVPLTLQSPTLSGVVVTLPAIKIGAAAAGAAGAAAGGSFLTSTAGIVLLSAAGAGGGYAIYAAAKDKKVTMCHNGQTITVSENAVASHLARGDTMGPCPASPVR